MTFGGCCSLGQMSGLEGVMLVGGVRKVAGSFVVPGPCGVAVRDRLKHLTSQYEMVLRAVGAHQGAPASGDLRARCADGLEHGADTWAARKRELTALSSSRIAGAITKATHDQWALARRCQAADIQKLEAGIKTLRHRLSLPIGEKGTKRAADGYRSKGEWFRKSRRLDTGRPPRRCRRRPTGRAGAGGTGRQTSPQHPPPPHPGPAHRRPMAGTLVPRCRW